MPHTNHSYGSHIRDFACSWGKAVKAETARSGAIANSTYIRTPHTHCNHGQDCEMPKKHHADPRNGVDSYALAEILLQNQDPRIKYVISNHRIFSNAVPPLWTWRAYTGSNPHDHHVHISVQADEADYDSTQPWNIGNLNPQPDAPVADEPPKTLRLGNKGDLVRKQQKQLGLTISGTFDKSTERAVRAFQRTNNLAVDGIVGPYTWRALQKPPIKSTGIVATVFGGTAERIQSAYDNHIITGRERSVALPYRFIDPRPKVKVSRGGKSVVCSIWDVGPWNVDDPYWTKPDGRPQSEQGLDLRGRVTNKAGIDLSPAAAKAIGIDGVGTVDWEFV